VVEKVKNGAKSVTEIAKDYGIPTKYIYNLKTDNLFCVTYIWWL